MFENFSHSSYMGSRQVLKGLRRSVVEAKSQETGEACFCLANSQDISKSLVELDLIDLYPWLSES